MKIGILGSNGFVGEVLKKYYPNNAGYDIQGSCNKLETVLNCEIIFVAINLKDNCILESSKNILRTYFEKMKEGTIVIIKSTFVPGTLDKFEEEFPLLKFVYNPEFLTEATAWEDFVHPQFQILGTTHTDLSKRLFELLPDAPIKRVISPLDAEMLKHIKNSYYALKVTWFNQCYDACQEIGSNYESIREILMNDPWIGNSHSVIFHKGYVGWGGKCLSKDVPALSSLVDFPLLDSIIKYNEELRRKQNLQPLPNWKKS